MTDKRIATLPKNSIEELRISLDTYAGHRIVNQRVWFKSADEWRPGKQGLAVRVEQLPDLIKALQDAAREAGV